MPAGVEETPAAGGAENPIHCRDVPTMSATNPNSPNSGGSSPLAKLIPIAVVAACAAAVAADLKSGLQVGEAAGYFEVHDVTGPKAGSDLCYR